MKKVYVVSHEWWYEGSSGDYTNCNEESILKIFDSEEKAMNFVLDEIRRAHTLAQALGNDKYFVDAPSWKTYRVAVDDSIKVILYREEHNEFYQFNVTPYNVE